MENFEVPKSESEHMLEDILAHYNTDEGTLEAFKDEWRQYSQEEQRRFHEQFIGEHGGKPV